MGRGESAELESELPLVASHHVSPLGLELDGQFVKILKFLPYANSLELVLCAESGPLLPAELGEFTFQVWPNAWSTRLVLATEAHQDSAPPALTPAHHLCHLDFSSCGLPQPCLHQSLYGALLRDDPASEAHLALLRETAYKTEAGENAATLIMSRGYRSALAAWQYGATRLCDDLYVIAATFPGNNAGEHSPCIAEPGRCYTDHGVCDSSVATHSPLLRSLATLVDTLRLLHDPEFRKLLPAPVSPGLWLQQQSTYTPTPMAPDALFPILRLRTPDPGTRSADTCDAQQLVIEPADTTTGYSMPIACVAHRFCALCRLPMPCRHPQLSALVEVLHADLASSRFGVPLVESNFQHEVSDGSR